MTGPTGRPHAGLLGWLFVEDDSGFPEQFSNVGDFLGRVLHASMDAVVAHHTRLMQVLDQLGVQAGRVRGPWWALRCV